MSCCHTQWLSQALHTPHEAKATDHRHHVQPTGTVWKQVKLIWVTDAMGHVWELREASQSPLHSLWLVAAPLLDTPAALRGHPG